MGSKISKVYLSSPTMHGEELKYIIEAVEENWVSTVGENINEIEKLIADKVGCKYAIALSSGTSALHLCMKVAGIKRGTCVFCSDLTFAATVNPIVYEGGVPIFIDSELDTWNIDPIALEKAFDLYPNVNHVVCVNLYGTPCKMKEILDICNKHNAILIEDSAESLGATYKGIQTGSFGKFNVVSFNGNKIITGSSGGMFLTNDYNASIEVRKLSTQARESAPWYQHKELGYNYRMSNIIAGIVRGQYFYLNQHIKQKKNIYFRYKEGFKNLPVSMNPYIEDIMEPNYWLSCLLINKEAMCKQVRTDNESLYIKEKGKSCPTEILERLNKLNIEGRPIWKPMHMQPLYKKSPFITVYGNTMIKENSEFLYDINSVDEDVFSRGLCLPSDNKMTVEEQELIISIVRSCFI